MSNRIGFIGLGAMGEPMARNLARSGHALTVWNRNQARCALLGAEGAVVAPTAADVFAQARIVFLMLSDSDAIDAVLERDTIRFAAHVRSCIVVNTATVSPAFSKELEADIMRAGGAYVEAPVSGSRKPAEAGQLIAMLAGDEAATREVVPLMAPMCRAIIPCGQAPRALQMKLATNIFLIASITGLAEAANFARATGLDLQAWASVVNASQMASDISRIKVEKLLGGDLSAQAAIANVLETNRLVSEAAEQSGVAVPLMNACLSLYQSSTALGHGQEDMIAVVKALEARGMQGS
jgi:3-hydroxyisobutyrate dehydrogenase